jgi:hypothetical protein
VDIDPGLGAQMKKNRCCLSVALLLAARFKSCGLAYFRSKRNSKKTYFPNFMELFSADATIFSKKFSKVFVPMKT